MSSPDLRTTKAPLSYNDEEISFIALVCLKSNLYALCIAEVHLLYSVTFNVQLLIVVHSHKLLPPPILQNIDVDKENSTLQQCRILA